MNWLLFIGYFVRSHLEFARWNPYERDSGFLIYVNIVRDWLGCNIDAMHCENFSRKTTRRFVRGLRQSVTDLFKFWNLIRAVSQ